MSDGRPLLRDRDGNPISPKTWDDLRSHTRRWNGRRYFRVGDRKVGSARVSTVWVGIDMRFQSHLAPLIFETMVFDEGRPMDGECVRYATAKEAKRGHKIMVEVVRASHRIQRDRETTYRNVAHFLWGYKRSLLTSLLGCLWCVLWLALGWADTWYFQALFGFLAVADLAAMTPYVQTYYRHVKPRQEGRLRFQADLAAGKVDNWERRSDAARWAPDDEEMAVDE